MAEDIVELCDRCLGTGHKIDQVALGATYRAKRKKLGYSLTRVARAMGVDIATLSTLEAGKRHWTSYYAIRFEQGLRILEDQKVERKKAA